MVTEILYAYLENIQLLAMIIVVGISLVLGILGIARYKNEVDKDDWVYLMSWLTPILIFFLFLTFIPGIEHIKDARKTFNEISEIKPKKEVLHEVVLYPSDIVIPNGVCSQTGTD